MRWTDEATELFAELIAVLPSSLRHTVQERAETCAEWIASEHGRKEVDSDLALYALMEGTPAHMRPRLVEAMDCRRETADVRRQTSGWRKN